MHTSSAMIIEASDTVTIEPPVCSQAILTQLADGMKQRVRIIYRPFAGNELYFYDQNLRLIQDPLAFYEASTVIYSNIKRVPGEPFEGIEKLDCEIMIRGYPTRRNQLCLLTKHGHYTYIFRDEYSLFSWDGSVSSTPEAYIQ